jgi:hypothetical protein
MRGQLELEHREIEPAARLLRRVWLGATTAGFGGSGSNTDVQIT